MGRGATTRVRYSRQVKLIQGFTCLIDSHITPPSFNWPKPKQTKLFEVKFPAHNFITQDLVFGIEKNAHVVSTVIDIVGSRLGQARVDFGANLHGVVSQFVRRLPVPFRHEEVADLRVKHVSVGTKPGEEFGIGESGKVKGEVDEEVVNGDSLKFARFSGKSQFPNGQLTYVAGEGLSTSAFLHVFGGLLQAQGQYPGQMRFSFSCKSNWGTRITPMVQWPERSFTMCFEQALAWQRFGLMVKPTVQFSLHPTFGGNNPGVKAELVHSMNEDLNLIGGCSLTSHPSAFASLSLGRSKWNGNVATPLGNVGQPSFSVQLNSGVEF